MPCGGCHCTSLSYYLTVSLMTEELMNRYERRSVRLAYSSCVESHFKNTLYMGFNLLMLTSFEVTTVTTMDSQEHEAGTNMQLPYKALFGGAKFLMRVIEESWLFFNSFPRFIYRYTWHRSESWEPCYSSPKTCELVTGNGEV